MSISKRILDLLRSNMSRVASRAAGGDTEGGGSVRIENLSDEDLERELRRRRQRRDAAERAASSTASDDEGGGAGAEKAASRTTGRFRTTVPRGSSGRRGTAYRVPGAAGGRDPHLARLYAQLECPYGADLATIRKHYRLVMRKYHPDMHSGDPHKQRIATELSQKLTTAYNELQRHLTGA